MQTNTINVGDTVTVVFIPDYDTNPYLLCGKVEHIPQATGDSWIIVEDDKNRTVHYVQLFQEIFKH